MSIKLMAMVWESGPEDHAQKLVLLAIADHANDEGMAYPSMARIARKCSMTERGARAVIRKLESAGWLRTKVGGARCGTSIYYVQTPENRSQNPERETRNDKPGMINPEYDCTETRNDVPPNHHRTIKDTSENFFDAEKTFAPSKRDDVQKAVEVFNQAAKRKGWPKALKLTDARQRGIKARLSDVGGLSGWQKVVADCEASSFLSNGGFFCFDWLIKPANFTKVIEGNYADRPTAASQQNPDRAAQMERWSRIGRAH